MFNVAKIISAAENNFISASDVVTREIKHWNDFKLFQTQFNLRKCILNVRVRHADVQARSC